MKPQDSRSRNAPAGRGTGGSNSIITALARASSLAADGDSIISGIADVFADAVSRDANRDEDIVAMRTDFAKYYEAMSGSAPAWATRHAIPHLTDYRIPEILLLAPPGHGKTTLIINFITWLLGNNPNLRIIVASHTATYSQAILSGCEAIMASDFYESIFGSLVPLPGETRKWTTSEKYLRRPDFRIVHPSLVALGVGSSTTGWRADLIIADDLVSVANSATPIQRNHVRTWWMSLIARLEPHGRVIVTGHRYFKGDIYGELEQRYTAIKLTTSPENPLWPERFSDEMIRKIRDNDYSTYMALYQQNPLDIDGSFLDESWIKYYIGDVSSSSSTPTKFMAVDPCGRGAGDEFSACIIGIDANSQAYIIDLLYGQYTEDQQKELIKMLFNMWRPAAVGIESDSNQHLWQVFMADTGLPLVPIGSGSIPKPVRIASLGNAVKAGKLLFPGQVISSTGSVVGTGVSLPIIEQWTSWPSGNDDRLDSVEMCLRLILEYGIAPAAAFVPMEELARRDADDAMSDLWAQQAGASSPMIFSVGAGEGRSTAPPSIFGTS